jgi:hypothetical protein
VVGWHTWDEPDMAPGDDATKLAGHTRQVAELRGFNDGRFIQTNFGNGVLGTFWARDTMDDHCALVDVTSVDKYAYTSPSVRFELNRSWNWPTGKPSQVAGAYGWQQDRMESFFRPVASKPNWVFIETARPFLNEPGAETISLARITGATWNSIIHGASGVAYFQHNNNGLPGYGTYSVIECPPERTAHITALNAQITRLAPVLNTQPYIWSFGTGMETSLKAHGGFAYIFAMTDGGSGSRTFALPPGINGTTVTVVDENRTIPVANRGFTDSFAAEHVCHIYRISLA